MLLWQSNKNGYRRSLEYNRRPGWQRSRMCMCTRDPQDPRGGPVGTIPLWRWRGESRNIKALPSYFLLEGCFGKGRRIEWQGSWVKRGGKIYAALLDVMPKKGRTGYKETWKRRKFVREKIRCYLNMFFIYKILRSYLYKNADGFFLYQLN